MSNKSSRIKKIQSTRIGNFIVTFEKGTVNNIKITAAAGNWSISYREDHGLCNWIKTELTTEQGRQILHMTFATFYAACNGVPDDLFLQDILNAYNNSIERMKQNIPQLSDQEDKEILEEEKQNYKNKTNDTQN